MSTHECLMKYEKYLVLTIIIDAVLEQEGVFKYEGENYEDVSELL